MGVGTRKMAGESSLKYGSLQDRGAATSLEGAVKNIGDGENARIWGGEVRTST